MTTLFFSNADYYKNEQFQTLMRNYNYFMKDYEVKSEEMREMLKEILIGDFYRSAKEWLFSVDNGNIPNYDSMAWRVGLE